MPADYPHLSAFSSDVAALAKAASQSTVCIEQKDRTVSGFFWRPDIVATASDGLHVRAGKAVSVVTAQQPGRIEGVVIGHDPSTDVALIRLATQGTPLPVATALPAVGGAVVAAGRSLHGAMCAVGFVALAEGPWRSMRGGEISRRTWIDMRLARPLEGAALLDHTGHQLGMVVPGPRRRTILIPSDTIDRVGQELLVHGRVRRGYLGVSVQPVRAQQSGMTTAGLIVLSLDSSGPAARAGIMQGDIFTSVAGHHPESPRGLARVLRSLPIGQPIEIDAIRAGSPVKIGVTIGESPAA